MTTYRGTDRRGAGVFGTLPDSADLAAFTLRKWRQGWRWLSVTRDGREYRGTVGATRGPRPRFVLLLSMDL